MTAPHAPFILLLLLTLAASLGACRSEGDEDPLRPLPAAECAPACVPATGPGISGPSICFDGCNYCQCTASGPRNCTAAYCPDGGWPTLVPWEQCAPACGAFPDGVEFVDYTGPSACYDGCNACLCTSAGVSSCTARACPPDEDMGVETPADAGTTDQGP
ncbi:MAG: hypothetical protein KC593_01460 [Myxococcales bacterium]|nr:hypothetical protein [Myxococcales bacterium]MCB9628422.1 hypothetical protein [Sandaracinaceae bacterium]